MSTGECHIWGHQPLSCVPQLPNAHLLTRNDRSEQERAVAIWRLDEDIGEDDWTGSRAQTFGHGTKLAFADIKLWIFVCLFLLTRGPLLTSQDADDDLRSFIDHHHQLLPVSVVESLSLDRSNLLTLRSGHCDPAWLRPRRESHSDPGSPPDFTAIREALPPSSRRLRPRAMPS